MPIFHEHALYPPVRTVAPIAPLFSYHQTPDDFVAAFCDKVEPERRVGKDGLDFKITKFRSMVKNAARRGPAITTGGDNRITPFGRFLRKTKLDELPQLFNVLSGKMAIVGPRPEVPEYVQLYTDEQKAVLSVRPGLTDPASIAYRDEEKVLARYDDPEKAYIEKIMPAKLKMNISYIEKASFSRDLALIFKTLGRLAGDR